MENVENAQKRVWNNIEANTLETRTVKTQSVKKANWGIFPKFAFATFLIIALIVGSYVLIPQINKVTPNNPVINISVNAKEVLGKAINVLLSESKGANASFIKYTLTYLDHTGYNIEEVNYASDLVGKRFSNSISLKSTDTTGKYPEMLSFTHGNKDMIIAFDKTDMTVNKKVNADYLNNSAKDRIQQLVDTYSFISENYKLDDLKEENGQLVVSFNYTVSEPQIKRADKSEYTYKVSIYFDKTTYLPIKQTEISTDGGLFNSETVYTNIEYIKDANNEPSVFDYEQGIEMAKDVSNDPVKNPYLNQQGVPQSVTGKLRIENSGQNTMKAYIVGTDRFIELRGSTVYDSLSQTPTMLFKYISGLKDREVTVTGTKFLGQHTGEYFILVDTIK